MIIDSKADLSMASIAGRQSALFGVENDSWASLIESRGTSAGMEPMGAIASCMFCNLHNHDRSVSSPSPLGLTSGYARGSFSDIVVI